MLIHLKHSYNVYKQLLVMSVDLVSPSCILQLKIHIKTESIKHPFREVFYYSGTWIVYAYNLVVTGVVFTLKRMSRQHLQWMANSSVQYLKQSIFTFDCKGRTIRTHRTEGLVFDYMIMQPFEPYELCMWL